jgi:hypothetical protein
MFVILNEVKNLIESISFKTEILRLTPQNDIATQSLVGEGEGEGELKNERLSSSPFVSYHFAYGATLSFR